MAPHGSDENNGMSKDRPIATLQRAQSVIAGLPPDNVTVFIAPGRYDSQSVVWHYTMPNHTIRFLGSGDSTVFDGGRKGLVFFRLRGAKGEPTNLYFEGLTITRYVTALSLDGDRDDTGRFNGRNHILNNRFIDIGGTGYDPLGYSTAVVRLQNSDDNLLSGNVFSGMISVRCKHLHAIYLAHDASRNTIVDNTFENACGDPIRARDASDDNTIERNRFNNAGDRAAFSEWHCSGRECTKRNAECSPSGNVFRANTVGPGFSGAAIADTYNHRRPADTACGVRR